MSYWVCHIVYYKLYKWYMYAYGYVNVYVYVYVYVHMSMSVCLYEYMHIYIIWMYIDCTYFQAVGSNSGPPKKLSWGRLGLPSCHQKEQLAKGCYSCCRQNKERTESQTAMCWWFKISQKDSNVLYWNNSSCESSGSNHPTQGNTCVLHLEPNLQWPKVCQDCAWAFNTSVTSESTLFQQTKCSSRAKRTKTIAE